MNSFEPIRHLLCQLGDYIRAELIAGSSGKTLEQLAGISHHAASDTIYAIDKISEEAILAWFQEHWPADWPVEIVMEGLDDLPEPVCFPKGIPHAQTQWKCIIDPIDGTRGLMYDKRAAWAMAGLAPQRFAANTLADIVVSAMTELPTSKQWRSDQVSAIRGLGSAGVRAEACDIRSLEKAPVRLQPSQSTDFEHGFSAFARYFPTGKALMAEIEEALWKALYPYQRIPVVFDDQYISCGGQFYEILSGHDRMLGDLRPLAHGFLGFHEALACHPYDVCTGLILQEAGAVFESPLGGPVEAPLDTTSPVIWIAFANEHLANRVRPVLPGIIKSLLS